VYAIIQIFAIAEAKTGLDQGIRAQTGQEAGEGISKIRTRQHVIRMHTKNEVGFFLRRISQSTKNLAMFLEPKRRAERHEGDPLPPRDLPNW
jgi:hypothetical protein